MSHSLENLSFQTLFDAAADAMLLADDGGDVVMANPAAHRLLGYAQGALVGLSVEALMPERYREHHILLRESFSGTPRLRSIGDVGELVALSGDGRELPVDISLSPLVEQGQSLILVTLYNASRRYRAEQELRASEERLRLAKQAAGLGIFDRDLLGNTLHWDERSRELWGLAPDEEVTYERFVAGIHPEDREARQAAIDHAIDPAGNGEYSAEFRVISKVDGSERWVSTIGRVFFEAGRAVRLVGVMQDISRAKTMHRKLRAQRAEMESLAKQQVAVHTASAIAHELNQPLAAISAYSEVALRSLKTSPEGSDQLKSALENCVAQSHRAGRTLHELLDFLQKGELVSEPMDINSVVREAVGIAQNDGYGGFYPVLQLEQYLPPVLGNRMQVQKVLINLLSNSVEAMREAGMPVAAITITVRTKVGSNMAHITVQDSGPGLDVDAVNRVFEPFFTTKQKGIGLGLAISRALVEAHGGQLWVDPDTRSGAAFHFTLPFAI